MAVCKREAPCKDSITLRKNCSSIRIVLPFAADQVQPLCAELDAWRERLDSRGPLPRAWEGRLRKELEAEVVQASIAMEGVTVTVDEVRRILVGDRPPTVTPEDRDLVAANSRRDRIVD